MRVLLWSELYAPYIGGAEIFASKLMQALAARGVEFLVVTSHAELDLPDDDVHEGIRIRRLPFRAAIAGRDVKSFARAMREAAAIKREFAPDVIHINAIGPSLLFHLRTASASDAPSIVTMQQEVLQSQEDASGTLMAQVVESADWVVGVSQAVLTQLRAAVPSIAEKSSCIYNGVDRPTLEPAPLPDSPHIVCLGRLVPAKGFDVALRAFALLAPQHPTLRFTIAGDGASRDELHALAQSLGIADRVEFLGWVAPDDVPALLNTASMVVMPSRREGMPIVAVQAALMARPIIATAVGGLPEIVKDGATGIIVNEEDAEGLARSKERLAADRPFAARLGNEARAHALAALDWDRTVDAYHSLYRLLSLKREDQHVSTH